MDFLSPHRSSLQAYRWVGEMEEIAGFVGEGEGEIYHGIAKLYRVREFWEGEYSSNLNGI